jgi:hypothetical protein
MIRRVTTLIIVTFVMIGRFSVMDGALSAVNAMIAEDEPINAIISLIVTRCRNGNVMRIVVAYGGDCRCS